MIYEEKGVRKGAARLFRTQGPPRRNFDGRLKISSDNAYRSKEKVHGWDRLEMKDERNFCHRGRYRSSKVTRSRCTVGDERERRGGEEGERVPPTRTRIAVYFFPFIFFFLSTRIYSSSCISVRCAAALVTSAFIFDSDCLPYVFLFAEKRNVAYKSHTNRLCN